jgi:prepilin-type N-terminal cleavage/methylation domain-containing protein
MNRGFTFIELMVSVTIFALVVIGIYYFFDEGQWLYLQSERKSRIQEMGRIAMEQMERDFRMIGAGVPTGVGDDGVTVWTPFIFNATICSIGFTADVDNGTDELSHNTGIDGDNHIFIGENAGNEYYISRAIADDINPDLRIVLVSDGQNWEDLIATGLYSTDMTHPDMALETSTDVTGTFLAKDSTVHTLERVFYRLINQAGAVDADGVCDNLVAPYCTLQRQEFPTNNPAETDPEAESANASWENLAKNVVSLQLSYLNAAGGTADPLASAVKIGIVLTIRERSRSQAKPEAFQQNTVLRSQVLIRRQRL